MNAMTIRDMRSLTEQQQRFVDELVSTACSGAEAARRAGFATPGQEAWRLMGKPHVMKAIRDARERLISGSLANIAAETFREVMTNKTYPASARVSAARAVFEAAGHLDKGNRDDPRDKPLHEMTSAELREFIDKMNGVIDGDMKDVTPSPAMISGEAS